MKQKVVLVKTNCYEYPKTYSFRPSIKYPEYIFDEISNEKNYIYDMFRETLKLYGYDEGNYNTSQWNPLGELIIPGNTVLIKPNLVMDKNRISENGTDCLFTHPSVVAAVIDYICIAFSQSGGVVR